MGSRHIFIAALVAGVMNTPAYSPATAGAVDDRVDWYERLHWPTDDCPSASPDPERSGVVELSADGRYVQIQCERWAYQGTSLVYRRSPNGFVLLSFPQYESDAPGKRERYLSAVLTGEIVGIGNGGRTLRVLRKYRGLGDCGQYVVYRIDSSQVRLKTLRVRECPDVMQPAFPPPERWPIQQP